MGLQRKMNITKRYVFLNLSLLKYTTIKLLFLPRTECTPFILNQIKYPDFAIFQITIAIYHELKIS